jgi:hypothetical protein
VEGARRPHVEPLVEPLDAADPRFAGAGEEPPPLRRRELVRSRGPDPSPFDPRARILRVALPAVFFAGAAAVVAVFFAGLDPGSGRQVVGREDAVRAAVIGRPRRVCYEGAQPCAWLTVVGDRLVAFNTNGPLPQEYGRQGIGWCPSSGGFGANATGSRFDAAGNVVRGPAPRGLDRFTVLRDNGGMLRIDFFSLTAGLQAEQVSTVVPPAGPHCPTIPFDRDADLRL